MTDSDIDGMPGLISGSDSDSDSDEWDEEWDTATCGFLCMRMSRERIGSGTVLSIRLAVFYPFY